MSADLCGGLGASKGTQQLPYRASDLGFGSVGLGVLTYPPTPPVRSRVVHCVVSRPPILCTAKPPHQHHTTTTRTPPSAYVPTCPPTCGSGRSVASASAASVSMIRFTHSSCSTVSGWWPPAMAPTNATTWARVCVCVCVCVLKTKRKPSQTTPCVCVCVCVCVCQWVGVVQCCTTV